MNTCRLAAEVDAEICVIGSIPIAVTGRPPVFACPAVAAAGDIFRRHAAATSVPVYAWGVMPDHVHRILGASPTCDIVTFVGQTLAQREAWRRGIKGHVLADQLLGPTVFAAMSDSSRSSSTS